MVAILTADLIDSSLYEEEVLNKVLDTLKKEFEDIQKRSRKGAVRLEIYRGDSFQGIIKAPEEALKIAVQIKAAVNRIHMLKTRKSRAYAKIADFKIAIGIGSIDLERTAITESNGQAFQFSGRTLDEMKAENRKIKLKSPWEEVDDEFNTSFYLLDIITDKWSTASAEVVYFPLKDLKEKEVAAEIKISQSAVNQRKKAAGWEAVSALLNRYQKVIETRLENGK